MPAVSFYLNDEILEAIRVKSKTDNTPVSKIIREAIEHYLTIDKKKYAKKRVLNSLLKEKPLGGIKGWDKFHKERTEADADRS